MISEKTRLSNTKRFIDARRKWLNVTLKELGLSLGYKESTTSKHLSDIDSISISELRRMSDKLHFSNDEIVKIVRGQLMKGGENNADIC